MKTLISIVLATILTAGCGIKETTTIDNPVLSFSDNIVKIYSCKKDYREYYDATVISRKSEEVPRKNLEIFRDDYKKTHVKIIKYHFAKPEAELHIGEGERIPFFESYGEGGARASARGYPCPDWQNNE